TRFFYFTSLFSHLPSFTLFPYTTLFRSPPASSTAWRSLRRRSSSSSSGSRWTSEFMAATLLPSGAPSTAVDALAPRASTECPRRSEEHTSELQSLAYLVCRLLLEKKK